MPVISFVGPINFKTLGGDSPQFEAETDYVPHHMLAYM